MHSRVSAVHAAAQLPGAQSALRHCVLLLLQHHHCPRLQGPGRLVRARSLPPRSLAVSAFRRLPMQVVLIHLQQYSCVMLLHDACRKTMSRCMHLGSIKSECDFTASCPRRGRQDQAQVCERGELMHMA